MSLHNETWMSVFLIVSVLSPAVLTRALCAGRRFGWTAAHTVLGPKRGGQLSGGCRRPGGLPALARSPGVRFAGGGGQSESRGTVARAAAARHAGVRLEVGGWVGCCAQVAFGRK